MLMSDAKQFNPTPIHIKYCILYPAAKVVVKIPAECNA